MSAPLPSADLDLAVELRRGAFTLRAACAVPPGITALLGPSGAGKSLTLRAIAGLLPLAHGRITLAGRVLTDTEHGISLPPRLRRLGYVPQSYALFPHLSVGENIAYALPRLPAAQRAKRVAELLERVHLPGLAARSPDDLSGGEAQRVALARALAAAPQALLLDEPLSALDAPTRQALRQELRIVLAESGVPALLVTHDLAEARLLAERVVVLVAGQVLAEGPLAEVLATPTTASMARLLGWGNVLPVASVAAEGSLRRVHLPGGQSVPLPSAGETERLFPLALALRADALLLVPAVGGAEAALRGVVAEVTEMGPYLRVALTLTGEPSATPPLVVHCAPAEGARLTLTPGQTLGVAIPPGAARLVTDDPPA